ncbi:putative CRM domain-containing protein [Helianthus anomalus]
MLNPLLLLLCQGCIHGINRMASRSVSGLTRRCVASFFKPAFISFQRPITRQEPTFGSPISSNTWWALRNLTFFRHYGSPTSHLSSVRCVISEGKPKFDIFEVDPPKKYKWQTKKRLKLKRKKEKQKRNSANKNDPRRLTIKGSKRKGKFANAEERIKYKLEKARLKESLLIERLKRYEVSKLQGPMVKPVDMTGEERFYMKKMAQKGSNYVPLGRRGVFGGVILNMHMHWKKHETVKVICKPCKPGQVQDYANEIARLSGGIPIQIIGDDTIVFYRGKDYVQPEVMSPIDTLSKKKALEKSKYEQSLESVRHFIAISEKELELYQRHVALYGNHADHEPKTVINGASEGAVEPKKVVEIDRSNNKLSGNEDDYDDDYDSDDDDVMALSDMNCTDESSTESDSFL